MEEAAAAAAETGGKKRRVRFEEEGIGIVGDEDDSAPAGPRTELFPKGRKGRKGDLLGADDDTGPVKGVDPQLAAKRRALARKHRDALDDTSIPDDISRAEEDDPEEAVNDAGVPMDPFHLKNEREEGYFDAHGNYVEYRLEKDIHDAWLDTAEVDETLAERVRQQHAAEQAAEDEARDMTRADVAAVKRRIADALEPGETVMAALRRLGGNRERSLRPGQAKKPGTGHASLSDRNKALFNQLTEDAATLMDSGEYNVYSDKQETFDREAAGYEAILRMQQTVPGDIFADADEDAGPAVPVQSSNAVASSNASASGYTYDVTSGYYYNSSLGYYYDPSTGLYGNPATGTWYAYDESKNEYTEAAKVEPVQAPSQGA
eukprot:jgi/Chlat1/4004/Chrsp26S04078